MNTAPHDSTKISWFPELVAGWIQVITGHAKLVVALAVLGAAALAYYTAANIGMNTDTTDMLSAELEFRKNSTALDQAFPQLSGNIVVVLDGGNPDLVDAAADAFTARLRSGPDLFRQIIDPRGDKFFRQNGFLYLDADELEDIANRLADAQPFLGTLNRDTSLSGLAEVLELALDDWARADANPPIEALRLFGNIGTVIDAHLAGRNDSLSWRKLILGDTSHDGPSRRIIIVQPRVDFSSLQPGTDAIDTLRRIASELKLNGTSGVRLRLTGSVALDQEELASVAEGMGTAGILSLVLVILFLIWGLRSWRLIAATLAALLFGLVATAAFATVAVGELNLISVAFAVLFIGLSVDFGIHYGLRVREAAGADDNAQVIAGRATSGALLLAAISAAIGFLSFLPTDYNGLAELGLIAGAGMFIALFANLTVLPAVLTALGDVRYPTSPHGARLPLWQPNARTNKVITLVALFVGVCALAVATHVRFDFDPLNLKDPNVESVSTLFDLIQDPDTSPYSIEVLAKDLSAAKALADEVERLPTVENAATISDLIPPNQEEKLAIIEDIALFLGPSLSTDAQPKVTSQENIEALEDLQRKLSNIPRDTPARIAVEIAKLAEPLQRLLSRSPTDATLAALNDKLLGTLPAQLALLRDLISAEPVTLEKLPSALVERQIAEDGRARVEIFPKADPRVRQNLESFVTEVRSIVPSATGTPVIILEAGRTVVQAFIQAATTSIVLIGILIVVVLREIRGVLLVFLPLSLAAILTLAATVLFNLPLNFANVIVLPLLFGLGVASGIHLVMRERQEDQNQDLIASSTPRAVLFSALTTIGSFGSIALSSHPGTSSMGILLTIAILLILVCMLVVLPALMSVWPPKTNAR